MPSPPVENRRHWHLDKTLNITHVLSVIALIVTVITYTGNVEKRVAILEERMAQQTRDMNNSQQGLKELTKDIRDELRALRQELMERIDSKALHPSNSGGYK